MSNLRLNTLKIFLCLSLVFMVSVSLAAKEKKNKGYITAPTPLGQDEGQIEVLSEEPSEEETISEEIALFSEKITEYHIGFDDVLEISVWQRPPAIRVSAEKITEYHIGFDDVLEISVWQTPELSKDVIVRPDGKISYPLIGDVGAYGLTLSELDDILTEELSLYVRDPQVLVAVSKFGGSSKISGLGEPELSRDVIVRPDGKISYPLIGDVGAYGLTLPELDDILTEELSLYVRDPQVLVAVEKFGGKKIFVLGEVEEPGAYKFTGKTRVIEAISKAGDLTDDAEARSVVVIRAQGGPKAIRVNLARVLKKADLSENIILVSHDIVYVPRNFISNINLFLEKIIPSLDFYPEYKDYPD